VGRRDEHPVMRKTGAEAGIYSGPWSHALREGVTAMLYWSAVFLIVAIIAAVFGFGGIAAGATTIAQVLFFVFLVVFLFSLISGVRRRNRHA
jgi:uncharacterized membrane protein YtjA (UPF0391 family)